MRHDNEPQSSVEASLQDKFENALKLQRNNRFDDILLKNGFVFFDAGHANLDGDYWILVNSKTGETIVDLYKSGKLPQKLIGYVDQDPNRVEEGLATFLTRTAKVLGIIRFRELARDLGVPNAESLEICRFKDPRNFFQKFADAW